MDEAINYLQLQANPAQLHEDESKPDGPIALHPTSVVERVPVKEIDDDSKPNDPRQIMTDKTEPLDGNFVYHWMKDINSRIAALEKSDDETDDGSKATDDEEVKDGIYDMFHTVPKVNECDWNQFRNKYSEEECNFGIDICNEPEDMDAEVEAGEAAYRARLPPYERQEYLNVPHTTHRRTASSEDMQTRRIKYIRINSGIILAYLKKVSVNPLWESGRPFCFPAPFKTLIHFHSAMEEELRSLEAKFGPNSDANLQRPSEEGHGGRLNGDESLVTPQDEHVTSHVGDKAIEALEVQESRDSQRAPALPKEKHGGYAEKNKIAALMDSEQAYKDLKLYVNLINEKIMPEYMKFDQADYSSNMKIRYHELWSLFRVGELVYKGANSKDESLMNNAQGPQAAATIHRLWRLYAIPWGEYVPIELPPDSFDLSKGISHTSHIRGSPIKISAYYLDFDGKKYSAVDKFFEIPYFKGEKEIHELPIFPLRFKKDGDTILEKLKKRGRAFQELLSKGKVTMAYDGWTLIHDPTGREMTNAGGDKMTTPEHIDSDVIVDFREAFLTIPRWEPKFSTFSTDTFETRTMRNPFTIIQWADRDHSKKVRAWTETLLSKESVDMIRWSHFAETDKFQSDRLGNTSRRLGADMVLSDEDLALLPSRFFAYALRDRKFIVIDIAHLKIIPPLLNPFNDLKIPGMHKKMILSIVYEHFEKKRVRQVAAGQGLETHDQDFIRGKGRGIVILLHGAPGVGKTATAEAVAHTQHRPLFPITCGDLGTTPEVVEGRLQETFRLANLWDCILLMDEAEIFLSQRQKNDDSISRNAMVSVFLRTLEYYPGILFLTTNRPGALDEAVKSRVHLSLRYPALELSETLAVFRMNLNRLKVIEDERAQVNGEKPMVIKEDDIIAFASKHFHGDPSTRWNGRQIRNAFQIAASLAHYQRHIGEGHKTDYIGMEHFEDVANASNEYDKYRRDLFSGKDDDELARSKEDRGYWSPDPPSQESPGYMQRPAYGAQKSYGSYSTPRR